jgi:outer membrane biosynthesis protein TonB
MNADVRRRARGMTVSVSALSVLTLSGAAASAADHGGPKDVEEHATVSNSMVTRGWERPTEWRPSDCLSHGFGREHGTASVSVKVKTEGSAVRATVESSSVSADLDRSQSIHPQ